MDKRIRIATALMVCGCVASSMAWAQTTADARAHEWAAAAQRLADRAQAQNAQAAGAQAEKALTERIRQLEQELARLLTAAAAQKQVVKSETERARQLTEEAAYIAATAAMDAGRYSQAMDQLKRVLEMKGARYDGALYWKAYAESKLGHAQEALETLQLLLKERATSRWVSDAKALEFEIQRASGHAPRPDAERHAEVRLLELNSLLESHAEEAVQKLQQMLQSAESQKTRSLTLFVLSQSGSPKAREVLVKIARGGASPDLQSEAVAYLGMLGSKDGHQALAEIYSTSKDTDVRRQVLRAYAMAGDRDRLVAAARGERDRSLRLEAVRSFGMWGTSATLAEIYGSPGQTPEVRREVIGMLFFKGDAKTLGDIARKEADPTLKQLIEQRLGQLKIRD